MLDNLRHRFGLEGALLIVFVMLAGLLFAGARFFIHQVDSLEVLNGAAERVRLDTILFYRWLPESQADDRSRRAAAAETLARTSNRIDGYLRAFDDGGRVMSAGTGSTDLPADRLPADSAPILARLNETWRPIHHQVEAISELNGADQDRLLTALNVEARQFERAMIEQSSMLNASIASAKRAAASRLRQVHILAVAVASTYVLVLIWLYWRMREQYRSATRQTDEILQSVTTGLMLLDRDYRVGEQYSTQLERIFQSDDIAGKDFIELLTERVPKETLSTVRDYLDLLFSERVEESLIGSLNPLDRVEVRLPNKSGRMEDRYLAFTFRRIFVDDDLDQLLVAVEDKTDRVRLSEEIETLKEKQDQYTERMLELLVSLYQLDPAMLEETLTRWQRLMRRANAALEESNTRKGDLKPLIEKVFRPMHTFKSEAAGLKLEFLSQRAAAVEESIAGLRDIEPLTGNDFLPATVRLEELYAQFSVVRKIIQRLQEQGVSRSNDGSPVAGGQRTTLVTELQRLVRQLADDLGLVVALRVQGLDDDLIPDDMRDPLRDILVQLIRNACAHGIERPSARRSLDKPAEATLDLRMTRNSATGTWQLALRDDGRGIDFQAIRERAIAMNLINPDSGELTRDQALRLMFHPGLTTARQVGEESGRGVGMDVVREAVAQLGASIRVGTRPGVYTLFKITIPGRAQEGD
jgi:HPt (histidine-containing phosphotransfer) domain-containing protein